MSKLFLFVVVIGCVGCTVSKEKVVIKNSQKKVVVMKQESTFKEEYTTRVAAYNDTVNPQTYNTINNKNFLLIKK
ncbi:hypothetical protein VSP20_06425 [Myroides phaeus]|uniref:hypothetical protein n=1 Tax=Myroides phaeus TaxID=702745 RepID=UPI002DBFD460|nr:hypothetical protein [Myroides phaeus]MEC4116602.1 hypothetical protein [Myroides phaeus]